MRYVKVVLAVLVLAAFVIAAQILPVGAWLERFQDYVRGAGTIGYVLYVLGFAICCVLVIPALPLTLGAGAIFGVITGTIVVTIGATLGAAAAFALGRTVFRKRVEEMTLRSPRLAAIDRAVAREGTKLMLLMRIAGFPPFTWTNYGLAVTGVGFKPYILTTFFGVIPGVIAYTWAGAAGAAVLTGSANRVGLIVTAVGAIVVVSYVAHIAARAIRRSAGDQSR